MRTPAVHRFLLGVLREPDPGAPGARPAADWEVVVRDAIAQGVAPFLYRWLKRAGAAGELPPELAARLERECFAVAARNMLLAGELADILRAFARSEVPCAPLRGLALAERLYGDITARRMGDLDLLVRRDDLPRVGAILRGLGFRELDRSTGFARAFSYTLEFFKDRHGWIVVEPHWTITYPPFVDRVDMEAVWRRCVPGRVMGEEAWLLGPEELLFHLCLHVSHRQEDAPLLWFYDVDRLLRQDPGRLDWSRVLSLAGETKLAYLLAGVLREVRALFATPIPEAIMGELSREPPRSLEGRLLRLVAGPARVDGKESLAALFALKGLRTKLRYARTLLFPSPEFMQIHYGLTRPGHVGLAYLRRVCRFSWEGSKGLVRLLF